MIETRCRHCHKVAALSRTAFCEECLTVIEREDRERERLVTKAKEERRGFYDEPTKFWIDRANSKPRSNSAY